MQISINETYLFKMKKEFSDKKKTIFSPKKWKRIEIQIQSKKW